MVERQKNENMLEMIWGMKTVAMMDVWTIEHVLSGVSIGHAVRIKNQKVLEKKFNSLPRFAPSFPLAQEDAGVDAPDVRLKGNRVMSRYFDITGVLFLAYLWETIEHYLEEGIAGGAVEYWFQGVEFWPNRIIFDPLMLVIGYWIAKKRPRLVIPARVCSAIWLIVHIFVFPNSMYLQEFF